MGRTKGSKDLKPRKKRIDKPKVKVENLRKKSYLNSRKKIEPIEPIVPKRTIREIRAEQRANTLDSKINYVRKLQDWRLNVYRVIVLLIALGIIIITIKVLN